LGRGATLADLRIVDAAARIGCSPAQLILRWMTQAGISVIPKASSVEHMRENLASLDLQLDSETVALLNEMNDPNGRIGPDPHVFESLGKK
jgi:2,5-diketo-D-gluconate reductase A